VTDPILAERRLAHLYDPLNPDRRDLDAYAAMVVATMTANVAQEILTDEEWASTLQAAHAALRPGGRLIFETRNPAAKAWLEWNPEQSYERAVIPGVGGVQQWFEVTDVSDRLVTFRGTYIFESDGVRLSPTSTLRFRTQEEVTGSLAAVGYLINEIREAPDRPGRELVFIAENPTTSYDSN
jgi:hypothetical protein